MKTKIINDSDRRYLLVITDPIRSDDNKDVVAALTRYADSCCWQLTDIRLTRHRQPNPSGGAMAEDDYCAHYTPVSEEEAEYVKSRLREFSVGPKGQIVWCTFDGIVRGEPEIFGYRPPRHFNQSGYFSEKDGLEKLKEIQAFWDTIGSLNDKWRIDNPNRQPCMITLGMEWRMLKKGFPRDKIVKDDLGPGSA